MKPGTSMTKLDTYEVTWEQQLIVDGDLTKSEAEEFQLMQEIVDACPSMQKEIFGNGKLGDRYSKLYNKKMLCDMSSITSVLAKEICAEIDRDMIKIMSEMFPSTATDPVSIRKLEELMGIKDSGDWLKRLGA